ncbi:DUF6461 domain-containing protein [Streptomyces anulatus]|uniref:DUF6461 domain-containing protein n=1 Tax=Streptomyces anulatus TaxID=1892 RepID=UPI0004CAC0F3|nr:DUF6461 domain-containing protein [Streptomyces anulatus]
MVDLSELFGEGWCMTLAHLAPAQALKSMGVRDVTDVTDGLQLATERLEADGTPSDVLLLGRELRDGWSLIVELEGTQGWAGMDRAVLEALSASGRVAASAFEDPNQLMVHVAADGQVVCELDAVTGRLPYAAADTEQTVEGLLSLGFSRGDEPTGQVAAVDAADRVVLALRAVTGVELQEEDFEGSWLGGLSAAGR